MGKSVAAIALACGLGVAAWQAGDVLQGESAETKHLVNRLWIERKPADPRDMVGKFVVLRSDRGRVGVVGRSSVWRHFFDVFKWAQEDERLTLVFPQARVRADFQVRTWACAGEAPKPFDLCLELRRGEQTVNFYSRENWVVRPQSVVEDLQELQAAEKLGTLAPSVFAGLPVHTEDLDADESFANAEPGALPAPLGIATP